MGRFRFASLFAATAMLLGLGFAGQATSAGVNLSKNSGVATYLKSHGLDPAQFAIQRGIRNYAGPHCPGAGWNCTVTLKVVQVASESNVFECPPAGDTCTGVVQGSATGTANNTFICEQGGSSDEDQSGDQGQQDQSGDQGQQPPAVSSPTQTQTCGVTQLNGSGNNVVRISQAINEGGGSPQSATQRANVSQTTGSGSNHASVRQIVRQSILADAAAQAQTADQTASFHQISTSGRNGIDLVQGQRQAEKTALLGGTQDQVSSQRGHITQLSTGRSTFAVDQHVGQKMDGSANTIQNQDPYEFCCASQGTNVHDSGAISQESVQEEFPNHNQQGILEAECTTTGNCDAMQSATQNGVTLTNSASVKGGGSFHIYDTCLDTVCTPTRPPSIG